MAGKKPEEPNLERSGTNRKARTPGGPGVNPFHDNASGGTGSVNPSGPTTGTEGWGIGPGEANTTGVPQGSLGKRPQHTEARRADDFGNAPEERHGIEEAGRTGGGARTFRCSDMGNTDCRFEVSGSSDEDLLPQIERHARQHHGINKTDEKSRRKILDSIRERRAA